jgi:hypothetical protein
VTPTGQLLFTSADRKRVFLQAPGSQPKQVGRTYAPIPVTDALWNAEAKEYVEIEKKAGKLTCSRPWGRPQAFPPIRAVAADEIGGFWLELNDANGSRYDIYDASGRLAGSVRSPARRVPELPPVIRNQKLYVAEQDADDVVSITVYRFRR